MSSSFLPNLDTSLVSQNLHPIKAKMQAFRDTTKMSIAEDGSDYDRAKDVKQFDETKAGVKGLVDSGLIKVPRFLIHPPENQLILSSTNVHFHVPVINLEGYEDFRRNGIIEKVREASETWGFFQMVNHRIPENVMNNVLEAVKQFHEQPKEMKMDWYSRDAQRRVRYYCNGDLLVSKTANWRDSILFDFQNGPLNSEAFPQVCRCFVAHSTYDFRHFKKFMTCYNENASYFN